VARALQGRASTVHVTPHHAAVHPLDHNGTWTGLALVLATLAYGTWVVAL
jgi:hypothetical protein